MVEFIGFSDRLQKYLKIKRASNHHTLQKFFKRMPTNMFGRITNQIIDHLKIQSELIALDSSGFTNDYSDKYYSKIRSYDVKNFTKCHIAIDVDSRIILYSQAVKGQKHDTKFAIASIRSIKKYNPQFIIANQAYGSIPIKTCINEEIKVSDQNTAQIQFQTPMVQKIKHQNIQKRKHAQEETM